MAINMNTWQTANALNTSLNQLANTVTAIKNSKDAKEAQKKEQEFQEQQHADNVDFANRNLADNEKYAELNYNLQKDVFNYQKELNTTQMEREDSAFRRQMNDLKLAGLSPLSAIGGNGASTTSLSAAQAPQYDMSGINQASGAYLDLAREYAALRNNMYSKNRELRQGASIAFAQMRNDLMTKGMSTATQLFNARVNAESQLVNNEYTKAQTDYLKDKHAWEADNGYRDRSPISALTNAILEFIHSKGNGETTLEKTFDVTKQGAEFIQDKVRDATIGLDMTIAKKMNESKLSDKEKTAVLFYLQCLKDGFTRSSFGTALSGVFELGRKAYLKFAGE